LKSKCTYDCAQLQYTIQQNSSDNLPSYLQTTTIAHMLSTKGERALAFRFRSQITFTNLRTGTKLWQPVIRGGQLSDISRDVHANGSKCRIFNITTCSCCTVACGMKLINVGPG